MPIKPPLHREPVPVRQYQQTALDTTLDCLPTFVLQLMQQYQVDPSLPQSALYTSPPVHCGELSDMSTQTPCLSGQLLSTRVQVVRFASAASGAASGMATARMVGAAKAMMVRNFMVAELGELCCLV